MSAPVPFGWSETTLGRVLQRSPSYGINAPALPRGVGKYPYLRITDIDEAGRVDIGSLPSVRDTASDAYILSEGDIVVARTGASVGKSHLFKDAGEPVVFAGFLIRLSADKNEIIPRYLAQLMQTAHYWDWIRENSARSGQPGVNGQQLKTIPIVLPPLPEQQAIAAALSDADGVVAGLERVIAKKRLIKQGAMQDLLTARRRLPGFSGEWEDVALGAIGPFVGGGTPSMARPEYWKDGTIPWVSSSDIRIGILNGADRLISDAAVKGSSTRVVDAGAILFVTRSGILRRFQPVMMNSVPVAINQDIKALLPRTSNYLPVYVFHAAVASGDQIIRDCMKTGTTVESIDLGALRRFTIKCPKDTPEQQAIATVLSDMDAEIQALESRLAKARAVKEGMMQNLLTGRVRLV